MTHLLLLFILCILPLNAAQIIYLNGTSSVGKSTLAHALQDELDEPYLLIGIDSIIAMMPQKVNNWVGGKAELGFSWEKSSDTKGNPLQLLHIGPYAAQMPKALRETAKALANSNFCLIIDDVSIEKDEFTLWKDALKGHQVLFVGLTAPLEVIEKRERERGNRQIGQARAYYNEVHKGFTYDLFLDTSALSVSEMVQKIKNAQTKK
jgi:chloramphenicol 3-O phosphotransferase